MVQLEKIFRRLDEAIEVENQSRRADDFEASELVGLTEIRIMGQMSLLTNDAVTAHIRLFATQDVDAVISGGRHGWVAKKFSKLLEADGLELDDYADEIWLPDLAPRRGDLHAGLFWGIPNLPAPKPSRCSCVKGSQGTSEEQDSHSTGPCCLS